MTLKIFFSLVLCNIGITILTLLVWAGVLFLFENSAISVNPLIVACLVLMIQLYINSWILERRLIYGLLNMIFCLIQILVIWFVVLWYLFRGM